MSDREEQIAGIIFFLKLSVAPWLGAIVISVKEQLSLNPLHGNMHKGISTLKESHYLEVITKSSSFNMCKI